MEYNFSAIENKWRSYWEDNKTFAVGNHSDKPKFYVLDMFPYPSGAGLHVGHPLGYIASDIIARVQRLKGFNVLHPMGFDAFGLPAEQYAISTGKHPSFTTRENSARYIEQLKNIGFSYDWDRMFYTSEPEYYKWTQWIFLQLFSSWYDTELQKARPIDELVVLFENDGSADIPAFHEAHANFIAEEWQAMNELQRSDILMHYRLAYQSHAYVNWCEALGTVLANDEVKDGLSERGGHPVERKRMRQWFLRITAYADRLLEDLEDLEWSDSLKEMQRNWIGKSEGALIWFPLESGESLEIFTTRPDTIFGASFMVLAPESEWVRKLTTSEQKAEVETYINWAKNRSERERQADVKNVTGVFTGSYAKHPFTGKLLPIWIGDYILAGYGSGAVMAVPAHDARDFRFAKQFELPIIQVVSSGDSTAEILEEAYETKDGILMQSDFMNGLTVSEAQKRCIALLEEKALGKKKVQFRLRDANFSRQRYWGEPFPIYYKNGVATAVPETDLPLELPEMDDFKPTGKPESPLAKLEDWKYDGYPLETDTMPGFAGSSWYFLRFMDPDNKHTFASADALKYWKEVDLYVGGTEHAVGHLLYSRFWNKVLFDYNLVPQNEPFKKLVNQGMIQGRSNFVYRINGTNRFVSHGLIDQYEVSALHVDVNMVHNDVLDLDAFRKWRSEFEQAEFILENDQYICGVEIEKMSKSKHNVVNPDQIVEAYGADTLRLYEMFLGPLEQSKPWNTNGIEGTHRFLRKCWHLFHTKDGFSISENEAGSKERKALHTLIKRISEDVERFSFNTCVSAFMICVNELSELKANQREILEPLCILLSPFAPHMAEELWQKMGHEQSVAYASFPTFNPQFLIETSFLYPVSFNGKMRYQIELPSDMPADEIEKIVREDEKTTRWLEGKSIKKVIVVPKRIVNIVMG